MPLTSNEVIDEQLTQLLKRTNGVWRYLTKPHSYWSLKGGWENPTHYLVWKTLKVAMWSHGSHVPSYEPNANILNLEGKGWLLMDAIKGESIRWIKSFTWFVLLIFFLISSMALLIWSISFSKCGTLHEAVPLEWFSCLTFSPSLTSWLWACLSTHYS